MGVTARAEDAIRALVAAGDYGDQLPSERRLADELGASRTTVRLILTKLAAEGLVRAEHGRGYYVTRLSDELLDRLAAEAEAGYDLDKLRPRP